MYTVYTDFRIAALDILCWIASNGWKGARHETRVEHTITFDDGQQSVAISSQPDGTCVHIEATNWHVQIHPVAIVDRAEVLAAMEIPFHYDELGEIVVDWPSSDESTMTFDGETAYSIAADWDREQGR